MKKFLLLVFTFFVIFLSVFGIADRTTKFENTMKILMTNLESNFQIKKLMDQRDKIISEIMSEDRIKNHHTDDLVSITGTNESYINMSDNKKNNHSNRDKNTSVSETKKLINNEIKKSFNTTIDMNESLYDGFETQLDETEREILFEMSDLCSNHSPGNVLEFKYNYKSAKNDYDFLLEVNCQDKNKWSKPDPNKRYLLFEKNGKEMSNYCLKSLFGYGTKPKNCVCDEYTCSCILFDSWNELQLPVNNKNDTISNGEDDHYYFFSKICRNSIEKRLIERSRKESRVLTLAFRKFKEINNEIKINAMQVITNILTSDGFKNQSITNMVIFKHFISFYGSIFGKLDKIRFLPAISIKKSKNLRSVFKKLYFNIFYICIESHKNSNNSISSASRRYFPLECCSTNALKETYNTLNYNEFGLTLLPGKKTIEECNQDTMSILFQDSFSGSRNFIPRDINKVLKNYFELIEENFKSPKIITKLKIDFLNETSDMKKYKNEKYDITGKIYLKRKTGE